MSRRWESLGTWWYLSWRRLSLLSKKCHTDIQYSGESWGCTIFLVSISREARCPVWGTWGLSSRCSSSSPCNTAFQKCCSNEPWAWKRTCKEEGWILDCWAGNIFGRQKVGTNSGFCPRSMAISGFTQSLCIIYTHSVAFKVLNTSSSEAS